MATLMLLAASLPIALLWLRVDAVLLRFGQQPDIAAAARAYVLCLLPDLAVTSFLSPLKAYLSSQEVTLPTLLAAALALALHIPLTVCLSDLAVAIMLGGYALAYELRRRRHKSGDCCCWLLPLRQYKLLGGDWIGLLQLALPCCLNTCLEWWSYEILVLLTGRLPDARRMVGVIAVTLNLDYLLFAGMLSLSVSASVRVSNELGGGSEQLARRAGRVSLAGGAVAGVAATMLAARWRAWRRCWRRGGRGRACTPAARRSATAWRAPWR